MQSSRQSRLRGSELAGAVMLVTGYEYGSTVKLQTAPGKTIESGGAFTSSTRQ